MAALIFCLLAFIYEVQSQCIPQRLTPPIPQQPCFPPPIIQPPCFPPPLIQQPCLPPPVIQQPCLPPPVIQQPCLPPPVIQQPCLPLPIIEQAPAVIATPVVSTIIDNSVSNALANAIQLLIVSNLIENTMNKKAIEVTPICNSIPQVIYPKIDVCNSIPDCFNQPQFEIVTDPCDINVYPDIINYDVPSYYQNGFAEFVSPQFPSCAPVYCDTPMFSSMTGPMTAEVMIPSAIPAQLNCNFGYLPNVPCVSVNVEPWTSFDCGCKGYGNGFYY